MAQQCCAFSLAWLPDGNYSASTNAAMSGFSLLVAADGRLGMRFANDWP
jgi:hypothetical protein